MNGTGPERKRPKKGRGLGKYKDVPQDELIQKPGKGLGRRWTSGSCKGRGKQVNYNTKQMLALKDLPDGSSGKIVAINGGYGLVHKLDALGIRVGIEITKISNQWMKGPLIIRSGNTEIALGYGMAHRIMIEVK